MVALPPVGTLLFFREGKFADGKIFDVCIVESARTQRFLVCLDPRPLEDCQTVTLTVWDTLERAVQGGNQAWELLAEYTLQQLSSLKVYQEFVSRLSDDDDQIIAVFRDGKVSYQRNDCMDAMKAANAIFIEKKAKIRFRVDGEVVLPGAT